MSEQISPPQRTLKAPPAALARIQKMLPVEIAAPLSCSPQPVCDKPVAAPAPEDPEITARRKQRSERINTLAFTLRQRWPHLFFNGPNAVPWAIGIFEQLIEALGCDRTDLRMVLGGWAKTPRYQKALAAGVMRRNLDGSEASAPTEEQQAAAAKWFAALMKAKAKEKEMKHPPST